MKKKLIQLYHHLPCPIRSVAASLHGYYLLSWRYGPDTDELVAEALERERWGHEKLRLWQDERLAHVLHRAATKVPYYREYWAGRRRKGDRASWEILGNWPILEKTTVRMNASAFVAEDCNIRNMYHEHTSGTTGTSLDLWWSQKTVRAFYSLFDARWRAWYGLSRHDRWANLGGQLVTPFNQRHPPFWVWNRALNQLYMSSYHLAPQFVSYYFDALLRYKVKYLWGYSSSLFTLAQELLRYRRSDLNMQVVLTNAEPLYDYQREVISRAFQCPVRETYGMAEIVAAASECNAGQLHLWPEVGLVEVFEKNEPVGVGCTGDLVCTGLLNEDMPLIRYRLGDRGTLKNQFLSCSCECPFPILDSIEGRIGDILYTPDGRKVGRLGPVFQVDLHVRESQIIQDTLDQVRVLYVPTSDFSSEDERKIIDRLQARMGDIQVVLEKVPGIPRGANGKFRTQICNLSPEEKEKLRSLPC